MQLFYKKLGIFFIVLSLLCMGLTYMSLEEPWRTFFAEITNSEEYIGENAGSVEIKPCIEKVQKQDETGILIIGDSVCNQMFSGLQEYNDDVSIVGSNGAITMAGQFILVNEYLKSHTDVTDIYLMLHPGSLTRTFDTSWGYQYTVMPFVETETLQSLDNNTIRIMQKVYGRIFLHSDGVDILNRSAVGRKLYLNMLKKHGKGYYPENSYEIADQYIGKIYELCEKKEVEFHLYPSPVSEERRTEMEEMEEEYKNTWLNTVFSEFFNNILYYPAEQAADKTHFSGEYATQECYNEKIKIIFAGSELINQLKME